MRLVQRDSKTGCFLCNKYRFRSGKRVVEKFGLAFGVNNVLNRIAYTATGACVSVCIDR